MMRIVFSTGLLITVVACSDASQPTASGQTVGLPHFSLTTVVPNPTGRVYATKGTTAGVYQLNAAGDIGLEQIFNYLPAYGRWVNGFATDGVSHVFAATGQTAPPSLDVLDPSLGLVGRVSTTATGLVAGAYREAPDQVFLCEPIRPVARLWVFDVADRTNPALADAVDIPGTEFGGGGECRGLTFDDLGDLWVTAGGRLIRLTLDPTGTPISHDVFVPGGNPVDVAFEPGTGRLYYSAVNANFVGIVDPTSPTVRLATINGICDVISLSPLGLAFTLEGHLNVGCGPVGEPVTDIVVFESQNLDGLSGTVTADDLNATRFDDGTDQGAGYLAYLPFNQPPTADAGSDVNSIEGLSVTLDGTGSTDPDGSLVSYDWTLGDGTSTSGSVINHTYDAPGVYGVTLTVTDDGGLTDHDGTTVTVISVLGAIQTLLDKVLLFELQNGIEQSLGAKLQASMNSYPHDVPATTQQMEAFIAQVEALRGNKLTNAEADELIAAAEDIIEAINAT